MSIPLLPEASIGLRVSSLPASMCVSAWLCVCQSVCQSLACPHDNSIPVQAMITKFEPWLRSLLFWGPSMSNLTSKSKRISFCSCPRDNSSPVKIRTTKFGPKVQNYLVKILIVLGFDWIDMLHQLHFKILFIFHRFCVFEILVRPAKKRMEMKSVPHPKWLRTNMFAHRVVSWTVEQSSCIFSVTIAGFPPSPGLGG